MVFPVIDLKTRTEQHTTNASLGWSKKWDSLQRTSYFYKVS